jgi:hypothetical protein
MPLRCNVDAAPDACERRHRRPRTSPRSRASACDLRGARRRASKAMAFPDAADDRAVGEHVEVVLAPLTGWAGGGCTFEDERGHLVVVRVSHIGWWPCELAVAVYFVRYCPRLRNESLRLVEVVTAGLE